MGGPLVVATEARRFSLIRGLHAERVVASVPAQDLAAQDLAIMLDGDLDVRVLTEAIVFVDLLLDGVELRVLADFDVKLDRLFALSLDVRGDTSDVAPVAAAVLGLEPGSRVDPRVPRMQGS
jgi:hypothetical protein